ncbi:thiamine pyrophosphate-binding protein [Brevibacterium sp. W7.2]|uniref:thiamine pyrophosphate-binding protein n=1 Tax=Brevibacterium sp. W7.2 TaxID=2823518 RepID=UPI001BAB6516|nr:thiamine pyrophosphate-binding protein [Brevibacterium sp. W7.2]
MSELTGGGHLAAALAAEGITRVFGIPGTHNLEIFAQLSEHGIEIVSPRHEQGAGFMADGAARVTGDVQVVVTTTGPAVLNALTALLQSFTDSVPVLLISPGMPSTHPGRGTGLLHEVRNQALAIEAILGDSHRVTNVGEVPLAVAQALTLIRSGRPRPASFEIPLDLIEATGPGIIHPAVTRPLPVLDEHGIATAAEALAASQRPLVIAGGGSHGAGEGIVALAEALGAGIILSANAKGAIAGDHPLMLGAIGFLPELPDILARADAVAAIGTELAPSDFWPEPLPLPDTVVRIDIDETQMLGNAAVSHPLVADATEAAASLAAAVKRVRDRSGAEAVASGGWPAEVAEIARVAAARDGQPWAVLSEGLTAFTQAAESPVVIAADQTMSCYYGVQTGWAARLGDRYLYPAGAGTLGFALPAAIGAKLADPAARVIAIEGDGGAMFTIPELAAAVQDEASLALIIVDNGGYGEIRNEMADRGDVPTGVALRGPDFPALASAMGAHGVHVDGAEALTAALTSAMERTGPTLIHLWEDSRASEDMLGR